MLIVPAAGSIIGAGYDMNGAIAGGQIGYNWQSSNWVFGLEADAQWSDEKGIAEFIAAPQRSSAVRAFPA